MCDGINGSCRYLTRHSIPILVTIDALCCILLVLCIVIGVPLYTEHRRNDHDYKAGTTCRIEDITAVCQDCSCNYPNTTTECTSHEDQCCGVIVRYSYETLNGETRMFNITTGIYHDLTNEEQALAWGNKTYVERECFYSSDDPEDVDWEQSENGNNNGRESHRKGAIAMLVIGIVSAVGVFIYTSMAVVIICFSYYKRRNRAEGA